MDSNVNKNPKAVIDVNQKISFQNDLDTTLNTSSAVLNNKTKKNVEVAFPGATTEEKNNSVTVGEKKGMDLDFEKIMKILQKNTSEIELKSEEVPLKNSNNVEETSLKDYFYENDLNEFDSDSDSDSDDEDINNDNNNNNQKNNNNINDFKNDFRNHNSSSDHNKSDINNYSADCQINHNNIKRNNFTDTYCRRRNSRSIIVSFTIIVIMITFCKVVSLYIIMINLTIC